LLVKNIRKFAKRLRAVGTSPAKDWSIKRRLEYIAWAQSVVQGLRGASQSLEEKFDRISEMTIEKIKTQSN
jgi:GTP diphosphokinase / guanosine-3',5'-bis(diphosphate) 3'-diphosphatase